MACGCRHRLKFCCRVASDISSVIRTTPHPSSVSFLEAVGMALRRPLLVVSLGAFLSMGASFRTANFVANAPTPQIAQQIGETAEHFRKEKALVWLGQEMAPWPEPCPLTAKVTM